MKLLCSNIILGSDRPVRLHGGVVLGVAFDKKIRSGKARAAPYMLAQNTALSVRQQMRMFGSSQSGMKRHAIG